MKCQRCGDTGWVCEAHPETPWDACSCGAAGMPCECNASDPPALPPGFKPDIDKDGWRH